MKQPDPQSESLHEIVAACLADMEQRGEAALEEACEKHPSHASKIRERVAVLRQMGLVGEAGVPDPEAFPDRLGEFRLLRRIGGGGMGVVYLALQESLGREVALKLVRPEHLFFPGARERFRREVETIARVQHPGIVPIYSVGEANGIPHFAMERIVGCTLADALAALEGKEPSRLSAEDLAQAIRSKTPEGSDLPESAQSSWVFEGSYLEACLRILRQATEALDHAHRRGVLHRDIKPSNIMVTPSGRVMLLDFGLASSSGGASKLTRTGAQLGSLPYMSAEQLQGDFAGLDARADIYALGVTLYEMLALRSPYFSENTETTRKQILEGKPASLRAVNPQISWDAETVCLTAMEHDKDRRYASAADFARDLENVLERRPIAARRAGTLLRMRRWTQRRPAAALGLAVLILLVVGGPIAYAIVERGARVRIEAQQARAEKNFNRALEAVQTMLTRLGQKKLENVPQVQTIRREIMEDALGFYRGFLEEKGSDPALREETARIQRTIGTLSLKLGLGKEAEAAWASERELLQALAAEFPNQGRFRSQIARSLSDQADVVERAGETAEADAMRLQVLAQFAELLQREPRNASYREDRVDVMALRANYLRHEAKLDESEAVLREALTTYRELQKERPESKELLRKESWVWAMLATIHREMRKLTDAEEDHRQAIALRKRLIESDPQNASYREGIGQSQINLGFLLRSLGKNDEAKGMTRDAVATFQGLATDYPDVPLYLQGQIAAANSLSGVFLKEENLDQARHYAELMLAAARKLHEKFPDVPGYSDEVAGALEASAAVCRAEGRFEQARTRSEEGLVLLRTMEANRSKDPRFLSLLADAQVGIASAELGLGRHARAAGALRDFPARDRLRNDDNHRAVVQVLAECIAVANAEQSAAPAERESAATAYATSAVGFLASMQENGFDAWDEFEAAPKLAPLRERPEFREFFARIRK